MIARHFHRCNHLPNEMIAEYMAELQCLSTHCDFGEAGATLTAAVWDRLNMYFIRRVQKNTSLSMIDLTLKIAFDTA